MTKEIEIKETPTEKYFQVFYNGMTHTGIFEKPTDDAIVSEAARMKLDELKKNSKYQHLVGIKSIICSDHPEWGTWGIAEDKGAWLVIRNMRGSRVLSYSEFEKSWRII
jgi:hypothetical protein